MSSALHLLAISVGNTRTRFAAFDGGKVTDSFAFDNARLDELIDQAIDRCATPLQAHPGSPVVAASVNPPVLERVLAAVGRKVSAKVLRVDRELPIPIGRQLDPETLCGEDRLLNAAAAYDTLKQAVVVVDVGTAVTIDLIDGAGTFHGGAILPGARMMLDALHTRTAQLPEVDLTAPPGDDPIGHNTARAMISGVVHGIRGAVRELVEKYAEHIGAFPLVVATGGDADLLFHNYELIDRIVPDLTLMGIAVTARVAAEQAE